MGVRLDLGREAPRSTSIATGFNGSRPRAPRASQTIDSGDRTPQYPSLSSGLGFVGITGTTTGPGRALEAGDADEAEDTAEGAALVDGLGVASETAGGALVVGAGTAALDGAVTLEGSFDAAVDVCDPEEDPELRA